MAAFSGKALFLSFAGSAGTVTLSGDFTQVTLNPSVALYEETAGADTSRSFVTGEEDHTLSFAARHQAGGTALVNALRQGVKGTVTIAPEGTASGKQKITLPVIAQGASINIPYNNVVDLSSTFQGNGDIVYASY